MVRPTAILRAAAVAAALAASCGPSAADDGALFNDVKLEVVPETHGVDPYPGELVLVRIVGTYRPLINISKLEAPSLVNFGWMNLVKDRSFETTFGNFAANGYERIMALFPEKTGKLTIGPFTHHLTVVASDGFTNKTIDVVSKPVDVNVASWTGPGGPNDPNVWWLPAGEVRVIDEWSADPNRVARGETVRRTVTIEADGVTAEQLPPPPEMRSPGIISFRGPNDRETRVTEAGPVARAVYRWDMRPTTAFPAIVEAIKIPWFDTKARTMREATIPAQRMAWAAAAGAPGEAPPPRPESRPPLGVTAAAGAVALLAGLAILLIGAKGTSGLPRLPPRAVWRMRLAAWKGDASAFRAALTELARRDGPKAATWLGRSEVHGAVAELDRRLYHPGAAPQPNLRTLGRAVLAARRAAGVGERQEASGLAPLDGPYRKA